MISSPVPETIKFPCPEASKITSSPSVPSITSSAIKPNSDIISDLK